MSYVSPSSVSRRSRVVWVVVSVVLVAGAGLWVWLLTQMARNPYGIRGGLKLEAPEGTRLYVGDKLVATGTAVLSWDDLMGWEGQPGLAMLLEADAGLTAEVLAGPGAVQLEARSFQGGTTSLSDGLFMKTTKESRLLRRADGMLDLVFLLQVRVHTSHERERRFLLTIRPRSGAEGRSSYFEHRGSGSGASTSPLLGFMASRVDQSWRFRACEPLAEFTGEINQKGLWEPDAR